MHDDKIKMLAPATESEQSIKVSDSALLSCSIAEYNFSVDSPCMYEGAILCRDCPRDECDMAAGRELHQQYFVAGWLSKEKQ